MEYTFEEKQSKINLLLGLTASALVILEFLDKIGYFEKLKSGPVSFTSDPFGFFLGVFLFFVLLAIIILTYQVMK